MSDTQEMMTSHFRRETEEALREFVKAYPIMKKIVYGNDRNLETDKQLSQLRNQ